MKKKPKEIKVHGRAACRALFEARPEAVVRVYLLGSLKKELSRLLDHCRKARLAYHVVDEEELRKVSGAAHHEGVCILARAKPERSLESLAKARLIVALDGVGNPHNLGAILRSAAHFGADAILLGPGLDLTPSAMRVAEGGAEHVDVVHADDVAAALERLVAAGFEILATTSHKAPSVFEAELGDRVVVVVGNERAGVSEAVARTCTKAVRIPGTGNVESLNVSAATAVLLAEVSRRRKPAPRRRALRRR